jgi:hypothetical protein
VFPNAHSIRRVEDAQPHATKVDDNHAADVAQRNRIVCASNFDVAILVNAALQYPIILEARQWER